MNLHDQNSIYSAARSFRKSSKTQPPALAQGQIVGQVRRPGMTYRLRLGWDGQRLTGRLGGVIFGENVLLETRGNRLLGTIASTTRVFAVSAQFEAGRLEFRFAGNPEVSEATFWPKDGGLEGVRDAANLEGVAVGHSRDAANLEGIVYLTGSSQRARVELKASGLSARIGNEEEQQIVLEHTGLPSEIALSAALIADIASRNAWGILLTSYQGGAEG